MATSHPYADAIYRVVAFDDGGFGVEVTLPDMLPTMVTGLGSQPAADAWIARHRARTEAGSTLHWRTRRFGPGE
jgi:hypothetical protein